jgi:hypothetical protein
MLENAILKLYRRMRDARRERRARVLDAEASSCDMAASAYRLTLTLSAGLEANSALQLLARRGMEQSEYQAREARRKAAAIRAGHRV